MNALFNLFLFATTAVGLCLVYWVLPSEFWAALPEPVAKNRKKILGFFVLIVLIIGGYSSLNTYGIRNNVSVSGGTYVPEQQEVPETKDIFSKEKDRSSVFSDRLDDEKVDGTL